MRARVWLISRLPRAEACLTVLWGTRKVRELTRRICTDSRVWVFKTRISRSLGARSESTVSEQRPTDLIRWPWALIEAVLDQNPDINPETLWSSDQLKYKTLLKILTGQTNIDSLDYSQDPQKTLDSSQGPQKEDGECFRMSIRHYTCRLCSLSSTRDGERRLQSNFVPTP